MGRLTSLAIKALNEPGVYCDGLGLYVRMNRAGGKSYTFRYVNPLTGKRTELGLGAVVDVSLSEARKMARTMRDRVKRGLPPREPVARDLMEWTFDRCAAACIDVHSPGWSNPKHREQWRSTLATYASPILGHVPVSMVDTALVLRVLRPLWLAKTETASRLRGRIEAVLAWATVHEHRTGPNPAAWRNHLDQILPAPAKIRAVRHHPALDWRQMAPFMALLRQREGVGPRALEWLILTATRTQETLGARWDEIDLEAGVWAIPATRMKARREHRVPLSRQALTLLESLPRIVGNAYLFLGQRAGSPLSTAALLATLRRMDHAHLTAHGFRSSFRDWCAEATATPREIAEAALAHGADSSVEAAYQRGDMLERRRLLMQAWADFLDLAPSTKVVPLIRLAGIGNE